MESLEFKKLYKALNKDQKEAVDSIDGPVMVVAGPGTGKTQILTLRIANILLKTDTAPENILALTFTESGVSSMRKRLLNIIKTSAYRVHINTFHGFANEIIQQNPEEFPHIIGSRSITDIEQIKIIEAIIEKESFEFLKPHGDPSYFVKPILSGINNLKREGVDTKAFKDIITKARKDFEVTPDVYHEKGVHKGKMKGVYKDLEKQISKNEELLKVYDVYEVSLREQKLYDYSDMIIEVLKVLTKNEDLLLRLQENYQYILVDEHQDTNNAQNKILERLASHFAPRPNLFVVGDEKQAIFRFQGASLENFLYFKELYPETKLVKLTENYRSTQSILDSAHSMIPSDVVLKSQGKASIKPISVYAFTKKEHEYYGIGQDIKKLLDEGVHPHEIAVLYRDNKDAEELSSYFKKVNIPHTIESEESIFSHSAVRKLLSIAEAANNFGDDRKLADYFHLPLWDVVPLDLFKLIRSAGQKRKYSLYDVISQKKLLDDVELENKTTILNAFSILSYFVKESHNKGLVDFFEEILRESGLLNSVLGEDGAQETLDAIDLFFEEIRDFVRMSPKGNLKDFLEHLNTLENHSLSPKKKKRGGREGFVRLMTTHKSKGLEFEYVFIVHVYDGKWGNKRKIESLKLLPEVYSLLQKNTQGSSLDDERRLLYVALTRAKKHVTLSFSRHGEDGREQLPSQFIQEIDSKLTTLVDTTSLENEFEEKRSHIYVKAEGQSGGGLHDKAYIKSLFTAQGMSVSALNNYLSCPWKYFYRNLIRLPQADEAHLMYGTAIHEALNTLFNKLRIEEDFSKENTVQAFVSTLQTQPFKESDFLVYKERGEKALSGWFDEYSSRWITQTLNEFAVRNIALTSEIILTGKLDKLEFLSEREVNVIDYKTGKPKTRNQITGDTKDSEGNIFRQIVFYKILLDRFKGGMYDMVSGEIDFVEPNERGKYVKEKFTVTKDDTDDLIETIEMVGNEILELSFWDKTCDDKKCEYCILAKMLKR